MTFEAKSQLLLDAGLTYAARGWHVFPCHTPTPTGCSCTKRDACTDRGKHPRTLHGLKDASTDEATIRRWWTDWPMANIGVVTGALSGLVVLDVDTRKQGEDSLADLEQSYSPLPETVMQITGNGLHYLFAHPGSPVKNGVAVLGAGLDIRGDGGYIIAAPSLHASGKRYCWEVLHEPDDTPLVPLPAWLGALLQTPARHDSPRADAPIPDGQRNETLFRLGCSMRAKGFPAEAILAALQTTNVLQCVPPEDEAKVATIAAQCAKYEPGQARVDLHQARNGHTPGPEPANAPPRVIQISTDVSAVVDAAIEAVQALPAAPCLYQRARTLCVIARNGKAPQWLRRQTDTPLIHEAGAAHLWELLNTAARWFKWDERLKGDDKWKQVTPPQMGGRGAPGPCFLALSDAGGGSL
jgi:Bifunctional DNA primase/polymerase, N-terminal/Primase C terminal 1 (PriCT-1)